MKKDKKKFFVTIIILLLSFLTLVCASSAGGEIQLSDRMLIQGIGIDEKEGKIQVSVRIRQPYDKTSSLEQVEGITVLDAFDKLVQKSGKVPLYSHNFIVICGHECGKQGLRKYLDFFVRYYETRPSVGVLLAENTAAEILSLKKDGEYLAVEEIDSMGQGGKINGWTVYTRVIDFTNQLRGEGTSPYVPIISVVDGDAEISGTAVFRGDQYCMELSPEESRVLLLLTKGLTGGQMTIQLEKHGNITVTIKEAKSKITTAIVKGKPEISIDIHCFGKISFIENMEEEVDTSLLSRLEEDLSLQWRNLTVSTLSKTMRKGKSDPFGFGRQIMQKQTTWWKEHGNEWEKWLPDVSTKINVKMELEEG